MRLLISLLFSFPENLIMLTLGRYGGMTQYGSFVAGSLVTRMKARDVFVGRTRKLFLGGSSNFSTLSVMFVLLVIITLCVPYFIWIVSKYVLFL